MQRRINVSLSEEAVKLLDRLAPRGDRSHYIEQLVKRSARDRATLRARLEKGYRARAQHDREIATAWDALADEVWQRGARR